VAPSQHERIAEILAEMEAEAGPIPPDLLNEARQLWQPPLRVGEHSAGVEADEES
jgi:hypothetical protein